MSHSRIYLLLLLASASWAAKPTHIDVKAELLINGKVVAGPRVVATAGESAAIRVGDARGKNHTVMTVNARPADPKMDEILLDLDLEYTAGERVIRTRPQIYAKAGEEALMTLEESTKDEKIQLRVRAKPQ